MKNTKAPKVAKLERWENKAVVQAQKISDAAAIEMRDALDSEMLMAMEKARVALAQVMDTLKDQTQYKQPGSIYKRYERNTQAIRVRELIEMAFDQDLSYKYGVTLTIDNFDNGREQGYHVGLGYGEVTYSFAENRNSDNIVIYKNFNGGDDSVRDNAKFFPPGSYQDAAGYILLALGFKPEDVHTNYL